MQYISVNSPSHSTNTRKREKFKENFGVGLRKENDLKPTKNVKVPWYNRTGLKACPRIWTRGGPRKENPACDQSSLSGRLVVKESFYYHSRKPFPQNLAYHTNLLWISRGKCWTDLNLNNYLDVLTKSSPSGSQFSSQVKAALIACCQKHLQWGSCAMQLP